MPMIRYGEPCWIEIPVTNAPRAIQFYRTVFEWSIDDKGYDKQVDGVERTYFFSKGNLHGSFMLVPEDQFVDMSAICAPNTTDEDEQAKKPRWSVVNTFAVEDMDETLEKVVECGGKIFHGKSLLGREMGSISKIIDTEGNIFALFSLELWD